MHSRLLVLFLFLLLVLGIHAQVTVGNAAFYDSNLQYNNIKQSSIKGQLKGVHQISVTGIANYVADAYVATFNLEVQEATKQEVDNEINSRLYGLKKSLVESGFADNKIKIELVSIVPAFEVQTETKFLSKSYIEKPIGYTCQKTITIEFSKSDDLETIMNKAMSFDVYNLVKVDFHVTDLRAKKDSLKEKCLVELDRKLALVKKLGKTNLDFTECSINDSFDVIYPSSRYSKYLAQNTTSNFNDSKKNITSSPLKSVTQYYSQIDYSNYDVVENPIVTEPVVQITYSISLDVLDTPIEKPQPKEKYKVLTPNGNVVDLNL